jgi:hypothetical protein
MPQIGFNMNISDMFDDAHRRVCIAKQRDVIDRTTVWIALAHPSEMKGAIKSGLVVPVHQETPKVLNWYKFTPKGWEDYDRRYAGKPDWFDRPSMRRIA